LSSFIVQPRRWFVFPLHRSPPAGVVNRISGTLLFDVVVNWNV
jgi:hypothetical protein